MNDAEYQALDNIFRSAKEYGMYWEIFFSTVLFFKQYPNGTVDELVFYLACEWDI